MGDSNVSEMITNIIKIAEQEICDKIPKIVENRSQQIFDQIIDILSKKKEEIRKVMIDEFKQKINEEIMNDKTIKDMITNILIEGTQKLFTIDSVDLSKPETTPKGGKKTKKIYNLKKKQRLTIKNNNI